MYEKIIRILIQEIHKFAEVDPLLSYLIVKEFTVDEKPPLPFFSYEIYDRYTRTTFHDYDREPWLMGIQIKSHAKDSLAADDMAFSMQKILGAQQVLHDLAQVGISVVTIDAMPALNESFTTEIEFISGVDVQLLINDGYQDLTQPGEIHDIGFGLTTKK